MATEQNYIAANGFLALEKRRKFVEDTDSGFSQILSSKNLYHMFPVYIVHIMNDNVSTQLSGHGLSEEDVEIHNHDLQKDESIEVSYSILIVGQEQKPDDILQKIATLVNVQLGAQDNGILPFTPFTNFDAARHSDKLFLYGPSGCGKSRAIFELVKENLSNFRKIYFINPRNTVGNESGRIKILDLIAKLEEDDGVIWDNFPDDLVKRDIDNARNVLELVSSRNVKSFLVALKPKYLEIYSDLHSRIPEFHACEVSFDKNQIKSIIMSYGIEIAQFREIYKKYIERDIDKISRILWQKEPAPLTILDYYKELTNKIAKGVHQNDLSIDGLSEAEKLLRSTYYYEHQFGLISDIRERQPDTEFLYTLKLCYESGLDRNVNFVEKLQQDIFNSRPPREAFRKLSTWVYLSGQYYAMHDISRESVKLNDYVKLKIMRYLTENFLEVVPVEDNQLTSFGTFFGRNIQSVSRDMSHNFLPNHISEYMKKKRYFGTAVGQGIGERFLSLEEGLEGEIMERIETDVEFARGVVNGLGRTFPNLPKARQQEILKRLKSGFGFALFFGESLGHNFKSMSKDLQEEILGLADENPQYSNGLGMGLGYIYTSLKSERQKEILEKAEKNSELTRGLGYGFANNFLSLNKEYQRTLFEKAEKNAEFAKGLGSGFGFIFTYLPDDVKNEVLERVEKDNEFAIGMGISLGLTFIPLGMRVGQEFQNENFRRADQNPLFAHGFGIGIGLTFQYLSKHLQIDMFEQRAERNPEFAMSLGLGLSCAFISLSKDFQKPVFEKAEKNSKFARGLGFGFGIAYLLLPQRFQQQIFAKIEVNSEFAYGLGYGLGYIIRFLPKDLQEQVFEKAEKNMQFCMGIGYNFGYTYPYIPQVFHERISRLLDKNANFVLEFAAGRCRSFKYLPEDLQKEVFEKAEKNMQFCIGAGHGFGFIFNYLPGDLQEQVFERARTDDLFACGLGKGIGRIFPYISKELQDKAFRNTEKSIGFSSGYGFGLGFIFQFLSEDTQFILFEKAQKNLELAKGLGEGIGRIFPYISRESQEQMFEKISLDAGFAHGLGYGMGSIFQFLSKGVQDRTFRKANELTHFANGLGKGLSSIFPLLNIDFQKEILRRLDENKPLAVGLGIGFGLNFSYLDSELQGIINSKMPTNASFAKGLGEGFGLSIKYLSKNVKEQVFEKVKESVQFAIGVGYGLAFNFPSLNAEHQDDILKRAKENAQLGKGLGFGLGHIFTYLNKERQDAILFNKIARENKSYGFAKGLGEGLGHSFPLLTPKLQEEILKLEKRNKSSEFREGLGFGLGYNFNNLDEIVQNELLLLTDEKESGFAGSLGNGLGRIFPSLSNKLQQKILKYLQTNWKFANGFGPGLRYSFKYLDKDAQEQISNLTARNASLQKYLEVSNDDNISTLLSEIILKYDDFPLPSSITSRSSIELHPWNVGADDEREISFSGQRFNYCIGVIDMMNSTKIASGLAGTEISRYYSIFLNAMATIVNNFGAKIIKNAGDALIYYFPKTSDIHNKVAFKDVLECGITMMAAHRSINSKMQSERLPSINYRISADYGEMQLAKSSSTQSHDLFGTAINVCTKINSKAPANEMVIGDDLYRIVKGLDGYNFAPIGEFPTNLNHNNDYSIYLVGSKQQENILNPFMRKSSVE